MKTNNIIDFEFEINIINKGGLSLSKEKFIVTFSEWELNASGCLNAKEYAVVSLNRIVDDKFMDLNDFYDYSIIGVNCL